MPALCLAPDMTKPWMARWRRRTSNHLSVFRSCRPQLPTLKLARLGEAAPHDAPCERKQFHFKEIIMKTLLRLVLVAPLALVGAMTALADPATAPAAKSQPAEAAAPTAERNATLEKVRGELLDWRVKFDAYAAKAKAETATARTETSEALSQAWAKTQAAAAQLEAASAAEWDSAKAEFQKESAALSAAWAKHAHADGK